MSVAEFQAFLNQRGEKQLRFPGKDKMSGLLEAITAELNALPESYRSELYEFGLFSRKSWHNIIAETVGIMSRVSDVKADVLESLIADVGEVRSFFNEQSLGVKNKTAKVVALGFISAFFDSSLAEYDSNELMKELIAKIRRNDPEILNKISVFQKNRDREFDGYLYALDALQEIMKSILQQSRVRTP